MKPEWSSDRTSVYMILKKSLKFSKPEPHDSYKLDSYQQKVCNKNLKHFAKKKKKQQTTITIK